ncbi:MAG: hypothetical protein H0S78_10955, partial [Tissierellales bacterium]|nr:hypothetical protein [Tissierellales bacterium]
EFQLKEVDFIKESKYKDVAEAYISSLLDKEHYATAVTQGVMSSFIPEYFQLPEMEKLWLHYV